MSYGRRLSWAIPLIVLLFLAALGYRITSRKYYVWLPGYAKWLSQDERTATGAVHIFFLYADHFEPGEHFDRVERWVAEYPHLADRHRDAAGRPLQHTWFYPVEQPNDPTLESLKGLVQSGYGETELHLHHFHDTPESGRKRFEKGIAYLQKFGFLKGVDGRTHFAFVHGNWGLDNSLGDAYCGNSRELRMLKQLGCFADFTFPSLWQMSQPSWVNNIYEATDDDGPKSYDRGLAVSLGWHPQGDLVLLQGPLVIIPTLSPRKLFFAVEDGDIHPAVPASPQRVDAWVRANIHVGGRPDWIFVKVHGHSASSPEDLQETLGPDFDRALTYMEQQYNDGTHYLLHYITAREAYNLIRAAADGKQGDPRQYFDYIIPPYETHAAAGKGAGIASQ